MISAKEGPIYAHEWNPKGTQFCVVYGFMPAKATVCTCYLLIYFYINSSHLIFFIHAYCIIS